MIRNILVICLALGLVLFSFSPEVTSYSKVSKNGQTFGDSSGRSFSWDSRIIPLNNSTENESRAIKDISITVSPIYVAPKTPKLKRGEAVNFPSTSRYTTIDHDMVAKLDSGSKQQIQPRFHPPANFEHSVAHGNAMRLQSQRNPSSNMPKMPSASSNSDTPSYLGPGSPFAYAYDFKPDSPEDSPPSSADKPISKPISIDGYDIIDDDSKPPDTYNGPAVDYSNAQGHAFDFTDFASNPSSIERPKPIYSEPPDHPPYSASYDHDYDHDLIYDHPPDHYHHHHHHPTTTTMEPEMNDQRLDKRPYSYYFIGKKLWYIPLYFSIYFIIYVAALVLKSVARHKITFPAHLAEAVGHARGTTNGETWWSLTSRVLEGVESFANRFGRES